jgi:CDP-diacylglycerol--glycerol-3-phosphate 3-phosphatidyltransferase
MGITDWYDGYVARRWGYVTKWGTFFDPLADKIATTAALVAFISLDLVPAWPIWIMVFRDVVVTAFRTAADIKGKLFDTSKGAKIKTFLQFVVIYYILVMYVALRTPMVRKYMGTTIDLLIDYTVLYILITITAAITVWTGLTYFIENWDTVKAIISRQKENGTTTP